MHFFLPPNNNGNFATHLPRGLRIFRKEQSETIRDAIVNNSNDS